MDFWRFEKFPSKNGKECCITHSANKHIVIEIAETTKASPMPAGESYCISIFFCGPMVWNNKMGNLCITRIANVRIPIYSNAPKLLMLIDKKQTAKLPLSAVIRKEKQLGK